MYFKIFIKIKSFWSKNTGTPFASSENNFVRQTWFMNTNGILVKQIYLFVKQAFNIRDTLKKLCYNIIYNLILQQKFQHKEIYG